MGFTITEETKAIAVQTALRPGENCRAVAYCVLMGGNMTAAYLIGGAIGGALAAGANKYGFAILTDYSLKIVIVSNMNTSKVKDVYDIPYGDIEKMKYSKGMLKTHNFKFRLNKRRYKLILNENAGKKIQNQKENVDMFIRFFTNMQNAQKAS